VEPKSPADKAGIKTGDIILAVDGRTIENSIDLPRTIGESRPGTPVSLKIWRQGDARNPHRTWPAAGACSPVLSRRGSLSL
jgi:serine protease Do